MSEKNLEQRVQELEQGQQMLGEEMKAISPASKEYWDGKFEELGAKLVELTNHPDEGEVEQLKGRIAELEQAEPSLKQQGAEEFVKSFEVNKVEDNELAQRIFSAIRGAGYDIVSKEQLAEAAGEAETEEGKDGGTPEPPYLHIIDHSEEGYFPWTEGRFAKIVEAV